MMVEEGLSYAELCAIGRRLYPATDELAHLVREGEQVYGVLLYGHNEETVYRIAGQDDFYRIETVYMQRLCESREYYAL